MENKKQVKNEEIKLCGRTHFLYLKGVAILAVLISHLGNYSGKTWFTPLGGIGVVLFLFCSGYGLTKSYEKNGLNNYWQKKVIGVYLPFVIVELLVSIVLKRTILDILLDLTLLKIAHSFSWYMQYLFLCYLLFWIGMKFVHNPKIRLFIWGMLAIISFFCFNNLQAEQALSFISGIIVAMYGNAILEKNKKILKNVKIKAKKNLSYSNSRCWILSGIYFLTLFIIMLAIKQLSFIREQHHYVLTFINLFMKCSCATGIICITYIFHPFKSVILWIGKISYPLYLVHGYFMYVIADDLLENYFGNCLFVLIVSFMCAVVLHWSVEWIRFILTKNIVKIKNIRKSV